MRAYFFAVVFAVGLLFSTVTAYAWTGPTLPPGCTSAGGSPPSCNTSAPLNVGTLSQVKNGSIGVNGLAVYGNSLLDWNVNGGGTLTYLNFSDLTSNPLTQSSGYGIRDNAGTLEFKNSGGSWQSLQAIVAGLGGGTITGVTAGTNMTGGGTSGTVTLSTSLTPTFNSVTASTGGVVSRTSSTNAVSGTSQGAGYWSGCFGSDCTGGTATQYGVYGNGSVYAGEFTGNVYISGTLQTNGSATFNNGPYTNDWFRVNGGGGIYWQAYGGGWYMQDSTWIRSYGSKPVYMSAGFDTGSPSGVGCGGGLGEGYTFAVCGSEDVSSSVTSGAFYYNSDERLKHNIASIATSTALSEVLALRPVTFNWNNVSLGTTTQIGFIAQEVQQVVPQIVETNASTTMEAVDYARVTPLLVGSVQALDQTIEDQQQEIDQLQAEVQSLLNK